MEFRRISHADATERIRTPAQESIYESYLLRKQSDICNLYSSNVFEGQCYQKVIKQINKDMKMHAAEIDREMKKLHKRMNDLKFRSKSAKFSSFKNNSFGCVKDLGLNSDPNGKFLPILPDSRNNRYRLQSHGRASFDVASQRGDDGRTKLCIDSSSLKPKIEISFFEDSHDVNNNDDVRGTVDVIVNDGINVEDSNISPGEQSKDVFFVTEVKGMTRNFDQKPKPPKLGSSSTPPQHSNSALISPVLKTRSNRVKFGMDPPGPIRGNAIRKIKSDNDLQTLNSTALGKLPEKLRSNTASSFAKTRHRNENVQLR